MTIEEIKQLNLGYNEKITIVAGIDTIKTTVFFKDRYYDGRSKKYYLSVRLYNCKDLTHIYYDDITSISKGWEYNLEESEVNQDLEIEREYTPIMKRAIEFGE